MNKAKIMLSAKEAELVSNSDWILTKNAILQKVKFMLEDVQLRQQEFLLHNPGTLPAEVALIPPKISRGENYKGLPWLVLDHPRFFGKDDQFAIRTMFWWGHFFSITLHMAGGYKNQYEKKIRASFPSLKDASYFIGVNNDRWEHHFEASNYLPVGEMNEKNFNDEITGKPFIKLAKQLPFDQWSDAGEKLFVSFCQLMQWLAQ